MSNKNDIATTKFLLLLFIYYYSITATTSSSIECVYSIIIKRDQHGIHIYAGL